MHCKGCGNDDAWRIWTWDGGHFCDACGSVVVPDVGSDDAVEAIYAQEYRFNPKTRDRMIEQARKNRQASKEWLKGAKISDFDPKKLT